MSEIEASSIKVFCPNLETDGVCNVYPYVKCLLLVEITRHRPLDPPEIELLTNNSDSCIVKQSQT